ncbi:hypothetical protein JTB14_030201 [Gonioctena quinquepunctata]|nr:hypothetical protein JTB14_030201 [Gonioctena quinquepunctata]
MDGWVIRNTNASTSTSVNMMDGPEPEPMDSESEQMDSTTTRNLSSKKKRERAEHKFRDAWLDIPALRGWLAKSTKKGSPEMGFCKTIVNGHKNDLLKHSV